MQNKCYPFSYHSFELSVFTLSTIVLTYVFDNITTEMHGKALLILDLICIYNIFAVHSIGILVKFHTILTIAVYDIHKTYISNYL